jgi:hypothetical protein
MGETRNHSLLAISMTCNDLFKYLNHFAVEKNLLLDRSLLDVCFNEVDVIDRGKRSASWSKERKWKWYNTMTLQDLIAWAKDITV